MPYQPDLIILPVTLRSMTRSYQLAAPLLQHNAETVRRLITTYDLNLDADDMRLVDASFLDKTLIGRRRELADLLRLQLYGAAWSATGVDQVYGEYQPRASDFEADASYEGLTPDMGLPEDFLALDVLAAFIERAGDVPVLLINEPIYSSSGKNSDLRYNFWYPRWAYDTYQERLLAFAQANNWALVDFSTLIAPEEFTDSPVHLTPAGSRQLAERVAEALQKVWAMA